MTLGGSNKDCLLALSGTFPFHILGLLVPSLTSFVEGWVHPIDNWKCFLVLSIQIFVYGITAIPFWSIAWERMMSAKAYPQTGWSRHCLCCLCYFKITDELLYWNMNLLWLKRRTECVPLKLWQTLPKLLISWLLTF